LRHDSQFVNQLLTLMDGVEDFGNVCVIASTNRPELIDSALLRPGRFDYSIEVALPSEQGCQRIFAIHTRKMPVVSDFDQETFAKKLVSLSGAEIAFVAREAAYCCLRRNVDFRNAIDEDGLAELDIGDLRVTHDDFCMALARLLESRSVEPE
jgi:SpoVK/Ycf46/Vps4 family AAA+-type ATPase